ncbi:hypothetical protein H0H92_013777 [Tricholoma furcatifolium]|nr:hypothetical protein H0H92_013777 [Tricholoma furcatifolium]
MEYIFATSDSHGEVCLRDSRMAFGPRSSRDRDGVVLKYLTKLTRQGHDKLGRAEVSSITFNSDGRLQLSTSKHPPTSSPQTASFGNFGLDSGDFFSAGSDDFRGHVWKIPSIERLTGERIELSADDWMTQDWPHTTGFTNGRSDGLRYIPVDLSTPYCYLHGHQSIVNSTLLHPHLLHAVTSGIERDIILHSPTPSSPCAPNLQRTSTEVRSLQEDGREDRAVYFRVLAGIEAHPDDDSESTAIRMFDHILREEGDTDVFDVRGQAGQDDSSSDETFEDDEDDDDSTPL